MHIYITICITLLTIIAAMHLVLKANSAGVGSIFKWISYFIVLVGLLILLCQLARGYKMMRHHGDGECKEECHPWMRCHDGMMGGMHGCNKMGDHCGMMKCCDMDEEREGKCKGDSMHAKMECKGMMGKEEGEEHGEKEEKK
jgi:hypothetical protein